jgi:hypothetical protein
MLGSDSNRQYTCCCGGTSSREDVEQDGGAKLYRISHVIGDAAGPAGATCCPSRPAAAAAALRKEAQQQQEGGAEQDEQHYFLADLLDELHISGNSFNTMRERMLSREQRCTDDQPRHIISLTCLIRAFFGYVQLLTDLPVACCSVCGTWPFGLIADGMSLQVFAKHLQALAGVTQPTGATVSKNAKEVGRSTDWHCPGSGADTGTGLAVALDCHLHWTAICTGLTLALALVMALAWH